MTTLIFFFLLSLLTHLSQEHMILAKMQNNTDNDTDPDPDPSPSPSSDQEDHSEDGINTIKYYFFKTFKKGEKASYTIKSYDYTQYYIILVCNQTNSMNIKTSESETETRLYLITDYSIDYQVEIQSIEDCFLEISFIPKVIDIDYFTYHFEKEYHKLYSPQNYIFILVDNIFLKEDSILYYDPYISNPSVKYIPLKGNTKFSDIYYSDEVESYDFFSHSYVPKDKYYIIKIHTDSSYDFYFSFRDSFTDTDDHKMYVYPTFYNDYLLKENDYINFYKINNERGVMVKLIAQSNPNVKIYVDEYYSTNYLDDTNREQLICCSSYVTVKPINGYAVIGIVESSSTFGDRSIVFSYYPAGGYAFESRLYFFETHDGETGKDYNVLGFKVNMNHFGSVKCNVYNLGGFKARGYYVGDRGLSHYFDFYKSESIDYYYPNDLLNPISYEEGNYGVALTCPCCSEHNLPDYEYKVDFIYYDESKFKSIKENNPVILVNNSVFEDFDNVTYKISVPKNKNKYLKIQISNCDSNYFNFHLLKKMNISYYSHFSINTEADIILNLSKHFDKNELLNLNYLYVYLEKFTAISLDYEFLELDNNYKMKPSGLSKQVNITINDNSKGEIQFYPLIFNEDIEYTLYLIKDNDINITNKCRFYLYELSSDISKIDIGNFIVSEKKENYTIKTNFEFDFKTNKKYSIILMAYQKQNYKYKYAYKTAYYSKDNKDEDNTNNIFQGANLYIFIGAGALVIIIICIIIAIICIKKNKCKKDSLENEVGEFDTRGDSLVNN